jgi:hypothetical protein
MCYLKIVTHFFCKKSEKTDALVVEKRKAENGKKQNFSVFPTNCLHLYVERESRKICGENIKKSAVSSDFMLRISLQNIALAFFASRRK